MEGTFDDAGGLYLNSGSWGANRPVVHLIGDGKYSLPNTPLSGNMTLIDSILAATQRLNKLFVMTVMPQSPLYKQTDFIGRYGTTRDVAQLLFAQFQAKCSASPNCRYYDANHDGNHDYESSMFIDEDHLATPGALQLSRRLDSAMVVWENEK